ncbi:MAG TPA: GTP-binding protein, partial [Burkholderiales bacterium]|nr:GTP-binding protein [Burkholderiales bacterium]
ARAVPCRSRTQGSGGVSVPIHVLSGFLGSGKTTLLNRVLQQPAFAHTAVVVNEVGAIGLDHLLIAKASDNVVLLEGGCLCCTVVDSLHETLAALHAQAVAGTIPRFERVIVETTGLADPAPIVNTLLGHRLVTDHYQLEALVVTVDAEHAATTLDAHRELAKQIALADRLVWTKLDLASPSAALRARIAALNPTAETFAGDTGDVTRMFGPGVRHRVLAPSDRSRATLRAPNLHDARVRSCAFVLAQPPSWPAIAAWWQVASEQLGERVLRSKGIVEIAENREIVFLQTVQKVFHRPERLPGWPDADHRSRIVFITHDVDEPTLLSTLAALDVPVVPIGFEAPPSLSGALPS